MSSITLHNCKIMLTGADSRPIFEAPFACQIPEEYLKRNSLFSPSILIPKQGDSLPQRLADLNCIRIYNIIRPVDADCVTLVVEETSAPQPAYWRQIL